MKSILDADVKFSDPEILDRVGKADMTRVLRRLGWRQVQDMPLGSELWKKTFKGLEPVATEEEIIVVDRCSDRVARISELVQQIHATERIPTLRIILALLPDAPID